MALQVHCPRCLGVFRTEPSHENRRFDCPRCEAEIDVPADPDAAPPDDGVLSRVRGLVEDDPRDELVPLHESGTGWGPPSTTMWKRDRPEKQTPWLLIAAQLAAVAAAVAVVLWLAGGGPQGPTDRLHAALDAELVGVVETLAGIDGAGDAREAAARLAEHAAEFNRLLDDPEPGGLPRADVAPAVWWEYGPALRDRLAEVRREKQRVFDRTGAGFEVSAALRPLPQIDKELRTRLVTSVRDEADGAPAGGFVGAED